METISQNNILQAIKDDLNLTDAELADRIERRTGYRYARNYMYMVRAGLRRHSDLLRYRLRDTFPDFFKES